MKLDRNTNPGGEGKYALVKLRTLHDLFDKAGGLPADIEDCFKTLGNHHLIDYGGNENDFFVIRLKDSYAAPALAAYAMAAYANDPEYALEVLNLAKQSAEHPRKRRPD